MKFQFYHAIVAIVLVGLFLSSSVLFQEGTANTSSLRSSSPIRSPQIDLLVTEQLALGPRIPGSPGSLAFKEWVITKLPNQWHMQQQNFTYFGVELRNFWITSHPESYPRIIVGAHYDTRAIANNDDTNPNDPVPGANDGASGVAAILELLNHIPESISSSIGFVLFDGEDQGSGGMRNEDGFSWDWIVGSEYFANSLSDTQVNNTDSFILLDMIGDDELELPWEANSDKSLLKEIWTTAAQLGYGSIFVEKAGPRLKDDHIPFIQKGIPSIDIIDFNYPEWHTTHDDIHSINPENIAIVADVIYSWLLTKLTDNSTISSVEPNSSNSSNTNEVSLFSSSRTSSLPTISAYFTITGAFTIVFLLIRTRKRIIS
ncbi:MAG: M28 family peptidase [Candidatus Kariarchaeaceae archaeon]|jgi:hypothetical protein